MIFRQANLLTDFPESGSTVAAAERPDSSPAQRQLAKIAAVRRPTIIVRASRAFNRRVITSHWSRLPAKKDPINGIASSWESVNGKVKVKAGLQFCHSAFAVKFVWMNGDSYFSYCLNCCRFQKPVVHAWSWHPQCHWAPSQSQM